MGPEPTPKTQFFQNIKLIIGYNGSKLNDLIEGGAKPGGFGVVEDKSHQSSPVSPDRLPCFIVGDGIIVDQLRRNNHDA